MTTDVTPIRPGVMPAPTPDIPEIAKRIEAQRERLFKAHGIVRTAVSAIGGQDGRDDEPLNGIWWSLRAAEELLNDVAAQLELATLGGDSG